MNKGDVGQMVEDDKGRRGVIYQVGRGGAVAARGADGKAFGIPPGGGRIVESHLGPDSSSSVVASGTAHFESIPWVDNSDGSVRDIDEAKALARLYGVEIPDDIGFKIVEEGSLGPGVWASYPEIGDRRSDRAIWGDLCGSDGKVIVRLDEALMKSDEGIVAAIGHEMHELNALRQLFQAAPNGWVSVARLRGMINADLNGKLHLEALNVSNTLIRKMREQTYD